MGGCLSHLVTMMRGNRIVSYESHGTRNCWASAWPGSGRAGLGKSGHVLYLLPDLAPSSSGTLRGSPGRNGGPGETQALAKEPEEHLVMVGFHQIPPFGGSSASAGLAEPGVAGSRVPEAREPSSPVQCLAVWLARSSSGSCMSMSTPKSILEPEPTVVGAL